MADDKLSYGDQVTVLWGLEEVRGTVHEIYGPSGRRHVVVMLTPELSGDVVDEPTTVSVPLSSLQRVARAG